MKILLQLSDTENFTTNEKSIARYILLHRERMLNLSMRELAQETYTSHSTVNRLTRKLGLSGFRAFMLGLAAEFQQENGTAGPIDPNYPFGLDESPAQIARHLIANHIPFLTITSAASSPLAQLSPIVIRVPGDEKKHAKIGPFASQIAFEYVLNVLYSCIYKLAYAKNRDSAIERLQQAYIREAISDE
ncbi:MurR/RpiR family transcriptional regulator [Saccharibacillus sacchari]|uniref:Transcriptional regulator n=1 Tax=Saccharibacillus sacchari DSM 19268 TaxID=915437 RepID=A0A010YSV1_9BACL|nr:hypothetical protein [Saccharibacillus sacchari]EXG83240.1 transcriptional regulator [Saccharibacillus sacchari DSM 19268]